MVSLKGKDILDGAQFSREEIDLIMEVAKDFKKKLAEKPGGLDLLRGYVMAALFFEPSTRTRLSFETAMHRLGGSVIGFSSAESTSISKGETLEDTIRTVDQYVDLFAMRHPAIGSAKRAAEVATHPVLNGGDGAGQHPTQALLDLFTILQEMNQIDGLTVTMVGDLKYGRTVHSLARLLSLYNVRINYVSPDILRMPEEIIAELDAANIPQAAYDSLDPILGESDVLYVTRVQKERFENLEEYEKVKDAFIITPETMTRAKEEMIVMHPLPRVGEISMEVDDDPRAAYFRQMEYGLFVRMALLAMVLGKA